jgi:hypothetical protein
MGVKGRKGGGGKGKRRGRTTSEVSHLRYFPEMTRLVRGRVVALL